MHAVRWVCCLLLFAVLVACDRRPEVSRSGLDRVPTTAKTWISQHPLGQSTTGLDQLGVRAQHTDLLQRTTVRLSHRYGGLRVVGSEAVLVVGPEGVLLDVVDQLVPDLDLEVLPKVLRDEARDIVMVAQKTERSVVRTELVILVEGPQRSLAWEVELRSPHKGARGVETRYVDAVNGTLLPNPESHHAPLVSPTQQGIRAGARMHEASELYRSTPRLLGPVTPA